MAGSGADAAFAAGLAVFEAGRVAESYRLLRPLADAGHADAQAHVGSLMAHGIHHLEDWAQSDDGTQAQVGDAAADREAGERFLEAASAAGVGAASFNLAALALAGRGGGPWEERKARAAALYALAYDQGFTHFGWLMNGDGPGQPYLDAIDRYASNDWLPPSVLPPGG